MTKTEHSAETKNILSQQSSADDKIKEEKYKKYENQIKKLKKCIQKNEREIEQVGWGLPGRELVMKEI